VEEDDDSNDCQQLEAKAAKAQAFLQECRTRRKELNEEIRALTKRVKVLEVKLPSYKQIC
jgi:membrane protein insertase Oxa1/YidC/SpoIIIJ